MRSDGPGPSHVDTKLARLRDGGQPRLLDLFSGCGGMTVGFTRAGFRSVGGIEIDAHAARSYALNFHPEHADHHGVARDIRDVELTDLLQVSEAEVSSAVDVVVGGPPCPSFTRVGRAKLREVAAHPEAFKLDERTFLYLEAIRMIEQTMPLAVLIENVPDVLNQGGHSVGDEIAEQLSGLGYRVAYTLMNAVNYGVPQMRDRFFLMAFAEEVGQTPRFPEPTHWMDMPRGYKGSRDVALKLLGDLGSHPYYAPPKAPAPDLTPAVTARDALRDLPRITDHLHRPPKKGAQRFDKSIDHEFDPAESHDFATLMREWPGLASDGRLRDHVTRALSHRDFRLFAQMKPGDDYPAAHRLGQSLWQAAGGRDSDKPSFVPPYDPGKFPNKWRKMEPDAPARTLMAHLGKDTYSHIHYDSLQARTITVREAARLQSFPDGFKFAGTMNPAFRQIGNAVPPLLATHLATAMLSGLRAEHSDVDVQAVAS